jgi:hypothetical protein
MSRAECADRLETIAMIIDVRTYTYHPSQFQTFLKIYAALGFPLTTRHLGTTFAIATSASGVANQTIQFFAYDDHDHRDRCRAGLLSDPAWLDYVRVAGAYIREQRNDIVVPTQGSPVASRADVVAMAKTAASPARIFDWSVLECLPGRVADVLAILDNDDAEGRDGGILAGRFAADTGDPDRLFELRAYSSNADRARHRGATEPLHLKRLGPVLRARATTIFVPTAYSPLR